MKNFYKIIRYFVIFAAVGIIIGFSVITRTVDNSGSVNIVNIDYRTNNGNKVSEMVRNARENSMSNNVSLFTVSNKENPDLVHYVSHYVSLQLKTNSLKQMLDANAKNIDFIIPLGNNRNLELELTRVNIFSKNYKISSPSENGNSTGKNEGGLYYRGIIKGDNNSVATISIFNNRIMGIISDMNGNLVLGPCDEKNLKNDDYVLYNDRNLLIKSGFKCADGDNEDMFVRNVNKTNSNPVLYEGDRRSLDTVMVYYVADYQLYLDHGSNANLTRYYISGIFNEVAALYQNESIPVNISGIYVYQSADPYMYDTSSVIILYDFGHNTQDDFMGDLAQLLSTGHGQALGGVAWINVLCTPYDENDYSGRYSFCNIYNTFNHIPQYSWTVEVMTHELGHNLGSYHTHACHWPCLPYYGIGAIDSCYYAEGNCFYYIQPNYNGTIMSYCHLNGAINLALGFGPLPGDTIRSWYALATCLHENLNSSEVPGSYNLLQNYPNPFNPSTNIRFALPEDGYVYLRIYDVSGRTVAEPVKNQFYARGIYSYVLDANFYKLSSGVYFYRLDVLHQNKKTYSEVRKMVLIK